MKVVLQSGFKNSGMLVGKRIMVAVRSTLKLDVPIAAEQQLMVSSAYLRFLVKLSNEKVAENVLRTNKLHAALLAEFSGDIRGDAPTTPAHRGAAHPASGKGREPGFQLSSPAAARAVAELRDVRTWQPAAVFFFFFFFPGGEGVQCCACACWPHRQPQ